MPALRALNEPTKSFEVPARSTGFIQLKKQGATQAAERYLYVMIASARSHNLKAIAVRPCDTQKQFRPTISSVSRMATQTKNKQENKQAKSATLEYIPEQNVRLSKRTSPFILYKQLKLCGKDFYHGISSC